MIPWLSRNMAGRPLILVMMSLSASIMMSQLVIALSGTSDESSADTIGQKSNHVNIDRHHREDNNKESVYDGRCELEISCTFNNGSTMSPTIRQSLRGSRGRPGSPGKQGIRGPPGAPGVTEPIEPDKTGRLIVRLTFHFRRD